MIDYTYFYKNELPMDGSSFDGVYDIFISAYNSSERVKFVFEKSQSPKKSWLIFPEYNYSDSDLPEGEPYYICTGDNEADQIMGFFESSQLVDEIKNLKISIDITGFMRPQLAFLLMYLYEKEVKEIDLIYSEPMKYKKKENTQFSFGDVTHVKQVCGFESSPNNDTSQDVLIIGSGYDNNLIKSVCNHKEHAKVIQILGFPSLRPDMYQENILKASIAANELGDDAMHNPRFAPANDPFVTASVLSEIVKDCNYQNEVTNLYLCPLSTKPQTIGFVLFFIYELKGKASSLIFPFFDKYEQETSEGLHKIWKYTIEFP